MHFSGWKEILDGEYNVYNVVAMEFMSYPKFSDSMLHEINEKLKQFQNVLSTPATSGGVPFDFNKKK